MMGSDGCCPKLSPNCLQLVLKKHLADERMITDGLHRFALGAVSELCWKGPRRAFNLEPQGNLADVVQGR
jgi:hypothetical protein